MEWVKNELGLKEGLNKINFNGETLAMMNKDDVVKLFGNEDGRKLYKKVFIMKQEELSKESDDIEYRFEDSTPSSLDDIFSPEDIVPQTIIESMNSAEIKNVQQIVSDCKTKVKALEDSDALDFMGMSKDEAYSILVYTYQASVYEESPYRVINQALTDHNMNKLKNMRGFILTLLSALRKVKSELPKKLFRGIDGKWLKNDPSNFMPGNVLTFKSFTSTSFAESEAMKFITRKNIEIPIIYEMHGKFPGHLIYKISQYKTERGK